MMDLNVGFQSSTRQRWQNERKTMEELLISLIEEEPKADLKRLTAMFIARAREDDEWMYTLADYGVGNTLNRVLAFRARARITPEMRRKVTAQKTAERAMMVQKFKDQITLLNLEMPNGKRMRNCTGTEMALFGNAFRRIARKCGKRLVGQVLNEKEVKKLFAGE